MSGTDEQHERVVRALVAEIRQKIDAPAGAIIEFAEILLVDARGRGADDVIPDLERILQAGQQLRALIDRLRTGSAELSSADATGLEALRRRLRHDLRTPLNAVKGYAELLRDDAVDNGLDGFVADLDKLRGAADAVLGQIDRVIRFTDRGHGGGQPGTQTGGETAPEAELAESLIRSIQALAIETAADPELAGEILVVDDNALNRDVLSRRLTGDGHTVTLAESGAEALEQLRGRGFDLILLDLLMPEMNGFEVLVRVKHDARWRDIPVIVVSALDEFDSIVRCIEAGAEDYLPKPINPILLRARIGASLERKRLREREQEQMRQELDLAARIQRGLLPDEPPPGFPLAGYNRPIRQVSGDFYDFFRRQDGKIAFALGDVSGKGFDAALLMAKTVSLFRCLAKLEADPGSLLARINDEICETASYGRFVTAVAGVHDPATGQVVFANAGNPPPLLIAPDGEAQGFPAEAPPLGILPGLGFPNQELRLGAGTLFVFSDGLIECRQADGGDLGLDGTIELTKRFAEGPIAARLKGMIEDLDRLGWAARDDLTVLAVAPAENS